MTVVPENFEPFDDEDDQVVGSRAEHVQQVAQFVDTAVDVADDVDVLERPGVEPPVQRRDVVTDAHGRRHLLAVGHPVDGVGGAHRFHTRIPGAAAKMGCYDGSIGQYTGT